MNTTVVYLDKVFVGNLLVNGLILWASGRFGQVKVKKPRLLLGAGAGAAYSLLLFIPGFDWLFSFFIKILVSLIMLAIVFLPLPPRRFIRCLCFFYLISFMAGGSVIGFSQLLNRGMGVDSIGSYITIVNRFLLPGLIFALVLIWIGVELLPKYLKSRHRLEAAKIPITIYLNGKSISLKGLLDTGSSLCDPVTGDPVLVVEHDAIKEVLPVSMKNNDCCKDAIKVIEEMAGTEWAGRLRLILFQSLGSERGLLLGIKPDKVVFVKDSKVQEVEKVVVCIHGRILDAGHDYNAIINPSMLDNAIPA